MKGGKVFISYRRDDAKADARSIYQHLERAFGAKNLFMDVDTIQSGLDFRKVIEENLADSAAMLVVISPNWLGADGDTQDKPLDDPDNFVRMEIALALRRRISVIPILVSGAQMPREEDLPMEIRELVFRHAARVSHENFAGDMYRIEHDLNALISRPRRWVWILVAALVLLTVLGVGLFDFNGSFWEAKAPIESPDAPGPRAFTSVEDNTDRPGGDFTSHRLSKPDALQCQQLCSEDQRCLAWTYVKPGYQEQSSAICWLKNTVPEGTRQDVCCISGVTYYRRPQQ